ncbi:DUF6484 domain-containing protein [Enhygromyxa salina]|uniref:DUF6484 domain-containing protein n=1 Tax=Enhygromyxa salina TaxID=215803 RepID=UPI0011B2673F|nr:DUF6484 domain-containing protein [Enhygromyxa salina]
MGRIVEIDPEGRARVTFLNHEGPPVVARAIGMVAPEQLEDARREARVILLGFLDGRADSPVIMSLSSMAELSPKPAEPEPEPDAELVALELERAKVMELEVDGEPGRQVIEAREELVLRCGDAAITLRADGTVRVIGRDITSWARRRHRIRGGSVAIN